MQDVIAGTIEHSWIGIRDGTIAALGRVFAGRIARPPVRGVAGRSGLAVRSRPGTGAWFDDRGS